MRISKKSLILVAVGLTLAAIAAPVLASPPPLYKLEQSSFSVDFQVGDCLVRTTEYSTQHFVLGRPMASTNIGTVVGISPNPICISVQVGGIPINVPSNTPVPFAVVDVRNPGNGTVVATYAIIPPGEGFLDLPVPTPVQVGANAWLKEHGPSLTYEGYVYVFTGPDDTDYLVVPFTAQGDAVSGFDVVVSAP
jgi:hypothetical protein